MKIVLKLPIKIKEDGEKVSFSIIPNIFSMEMLMEYGWAILIIAVILGVLFSLGAI